MNRGGSLLQTLTPKVVVGSYVDTDDALERSGYGSMSPYLLTSLLTYEGTECPNWALVLMETHHQAITNILSSSRLCSGIASEQPKGSPFQKTLVESL